MKKITESTLSLIIALMFSSCENSTFNLDYKAPLTIEYTGVDNNNIVTLDKGVTSYTAKIEVKASSTEIKYFEIYNADPKSGNKGTLIAGTSMSFDNGDGKGVPSYSVQYVMNNIVQNQCIKAIATDKDGNTYEHNLLVSITPVVLFSNAVKIETQEDYYGCYFASWLDGRVYMRSSGEPYKNEIDFSLGDVVIQSEGTAAVPALVNPAERQNMGLLSINGLTSTKFELTTLTKAQYDAVTQVNDAPITSLADPAKDAVKLVTGKVYSFKSSTGKKGLIYISSISTKTGTIQNTAGEWIKNTSYSQVSLTAKTVKLP
jgi:hypothetical protein